MSRKSKLPKPPQEKAVVPANAKNGFPSNYRKKYMKKAPFDFPSLSRDLQLLIFKHMVHLFKDCLYDLGKVSNTWYYIFNNVNYQARFWGKMTYERTTCLLRNLNCPPNNYTLSVMVFEQPPENPTKCNLHMHTGVSVYYENSYANIWLMHYTPVTWKNLPMPVPKLIDINQFHNYMRMAFLRGEEVVKSIYRVISQEADRRVAPSIYAFRHLDHDGVAKFLQAYDKKLLSETFATWCLNQNWFTKSPTIVIEMITRKFSLQNVNDYISKHIVSDRIYRNRHMKLILSLMTSILLNSDPKISENLEYYIEQYRNILTAASSSVVNHEFLNVLDHVNKSKLPSITFDTYVASDLIKYRLKQIEGAFIYASNVHPTKDVLVYADYESENKDLFKISKHDEKSRKAHIRLQKEKRLEEDRRNSLYTSHRSYLLYKDKKYDPDDEDTFSDDHPE